ncbi:hypothetical protein [Kitasatospora sp. NPDC088346]|uniref:hypothetical protein n=1 Tax=Kitasatospora sp. NPDC088346 TaxID=3364073 RepID=UPI0037F7FE24
MTVTNDAPEPPATAEDRWQHIEDRLAAIERRIREQSSAAIATIDTCLARLDALRHDLAHQPWPPQSFPTPADPPTIPPKQPARAPTWNSSGPTGHRHAPTAPDAPQHSPAVGHQAAVRVPA